MFTVYHSNQIDVLKTLLVELIKRDPLENPLEAEQILVQSPGMSQWLKMALAEEFGVAANLEFPLPATFIWNMFSHVLPDVPERSFFNKEAMVWKLMTLLPKQLEHPEFAPLKQYLSDDEQQIKQYQLAEKIADIFDGYLVYRPEWIASWEAGQSVDEIEGEHEWQPMLWQALYDYTVSLDQSPYHRANLYEHFIDTLQSYQGEFDKLPKRLFIFGISSLPPRYLDALKALGEHIDVHLMFTNPCQYYWGEVRDKRFIAKLAAKHRQHLVFNQQQSAIDGETPILKGSIEQNTLDELHVDAVGNSLLASMGKLGRDNLYLLSQLESNEIEAFVDIERDTLLHQLQADILNLEEHQDDNILDSSVHKQVVQADDKSVTVHVCHSAMREVEVLHDQLLAMFERQPDLKPRDIIVMVADINAYSPAIQAVFGNASADRYIPFSISDRTADKESPILNAFSSLLLLPESRCTASELLELLETPAIMRKFGLDYSDFQQAKLWVEASGIRWGLSPQTATEFDLPMGEQNTWQFGIERMLLGYAMAVDAPLFESSHGTIAPYNEVQGLSAELAGKLAHYIESVGQYRARLGQVQTVADWQVCLGELLEGFFAPELEEEVALHGIRNTLGQLSQQLSDAGYQESLEPIIVRQYLENKLSGSRVSQRFLAGQVNFCTLMPMRSIPFKTVCLLGMNDGAYPRNVAPEGFDLMNGRVKPGDRSRRDDDRYLFLEALLSAQDSLYISYIGRSIQDNTERVPSVLVSELMEYCQQNYCLDGQQTLDVDRSGNQLLETLTQHYPMVPFSRHAFELGSYAREWLPVANREQDNLVSQGQPVSNYWFEATFPYELDLVELQRFWRLPVQYFFTRRLKVMFDELDNPLLDDEPFALDGLQSFQMKSELLSVLLECEPSQLHSAVTNFVANKRAQGSLPVGAFGELEFESNRVQIEALQTELQQYCSAPLEDVEVRVTLTALGEQKPIHLVGWLQQHYQSGLVRYRVGRIRSQDMLSAWIDHLCLCAMGHSKPTHLIGYDRKEGVVHWVIPAMSRDQSHRLLNELARLFSEGINAPLPYFPTTALSAVEAGFSRGNWVEDDEKSLKKMAGAFEGGYMMSGEGENEYIARVWPTWDEDLANQVLALSRLVIQAPRLNLKTVEDFRNEVSVNTDS
ncbi:exodeoxyribonuclease V subunit gamma [Vibrio astriarenae]|uniref:RecBCD enzyme subunit RecC n=1 Tax=Vibrio astriarenae TaxID=1481923 RepID=A0A7Z2T1L5_9VIBR|nr:exodeoxyribonuclease V subunit gamma [Vibrio astriarenae]QIA62622.1 exodeoxyribonuclease V subunit gamma [Vibrio astriarenae]